jgi:hypothetical protein
MDTNACQVQKSRETTKKRAPRPQRGLTARGRGLHAKRPKETSRQWFARIESFKAYLVGDTFEDHGYVEDWARAEFKRKRKEIASLL